jgi:hypothetical protein
MQEKIRRLVQQQWAGLIALFLVLSGGTALASHEDIFSNDIVDGEVKTQDIGSGQVRTVDLGTNSVTSGRIAGQAVQSSDVANDTTGNALTGIDIDESALDATPLRTRVAQGGCQGNSPDDVMVKVGSVCVDRYENSIWDAPTGGNQITGAIPCNANGQDCTNIYARSVAGVTPRADITWFQAQQALANSGKRLPTNAEWQMAVAGTPDSEACNIATSSVANTGAKAACVSNWGANDMVGNLWEWVADWDEVAAGCQNWPPAGFGSDLT